jgi:membrane-associated HD superfamily phosphohydrolase
MRAREKLYLAPKVLLPFAVLLPVVALLVGCDSSNTTTSQTASVAAATTTPTATQTTPKKLTKKEVADQRARERAQRAREAEEARATAKQAKENEAREARGAAATARKSKEHEAEAQAAEYAKKVVEVWKQESVEATDSNVLSIQHHLVSLSHKCSQTVPTLAGYINSGVEILKKEGISETPMEIAAGLDNAAPGNKVAPDCRGILAALLVLIEKG